MRSLKSIRSWTPDRIKEYLADPAHPVKKKVALLRTGLAEETEPWARDLLLATIADRPEAPLLVAAIDTLGRRGDADSAAPGSLEPLLGHPDETVVVATVGALARLAPGRALALLPALAGDERWGPRVAALMALTQITPDGGGALLELASASPHEGIRKSALWVLCKLPPARSLSMLLTLFDGETDPFLMADEAAVIAAIATRQELDLIDPLVARLDAALAHPAERRPEHGLKRMLLELIRLKLVHGAREEEEPHRDAVANRLEEERSTATSVLGEGAPSPSGRPVAGDRSAPPTPGASPVSPAAPTSPASRASPDPQATPSLPSSPASPSAAATSAPPAPSAPPRPPLAVWAPPAAAPGAAAGQLPAATPSDGPASVPAAPASLEGTRHVALWVGCVGVSLAVALILRGLPGAPPPAATQSAPGREGSAGPVEPTSHPLGHLGDRVQIEGRLLSSVPDQRLFVLAGPDRCMVTVVMKEGSRAAALAPGAAVVATGVIRRIRSRGAIYLQGLEIRTP